MFAIGPGASLPLRRDMAGPAFCGKTQTSRVPPRLRTVEGAAQEMADDDHLGNDRREAIESVPDCGGSKHRFNRHDMPLRKFRRQFFDLKAKAVDRRCETAVSETRPDLLDGEIDQRRPGRKMTIEGRYQQRLARTIALAEGVYMCK